MMSFVTWLPAFVAFFATAVLTSPLPEKTDVKFDQRQEGEFNLRADLENFVILLIPTSPTAAPPAGGNVSLLDLLSKSVPFRSHQKRNKHVKKDGHDLQESSAETMHFIESKTAPYHVDISRTRNQLGKLHPQQVNEDAEVVVAESPAISFQKGREHHRGKAASRVSRTFVITVPVETSTSGKKTDDGVKKEAVKKDVKRKHYKDASNGSYLKLLGAENEQCGPGLTRDAEGICRINKA